MAPRSPLPVPCAITTACCDPVFGDAPCSRLDERSRTEDTLNVTSRACVQELPDRAWRNSKDALLYKEASAPNPAGPRHNQEASLQLFQRSQQGVRLQPPH